MLSRLRCSTDPGRGDRRSCRRTGERAQATLSSTTRSRRSRRRSRAVTRPRRAGPENTDRRRMPSADRTAPSPRADARRGRSSTTATSRGRRRPHPSPTRRADMSRRSSRCQRTRRHALERTDLLEYDGAHIGTGGIRPVPLDDAANRAIEIPAGFPAKPPPSA